MRTAVPYTDPALPFVIRGTLAVYAGAAFTLAGIPIIGVPLTRYAIRQARHAARIDGIGFVAFGQWAAARIVAWWRQR